MRTHHHLVYLAISAAKNVDFDTLRFDESLPGQTLNPPAYLFAAYMDCLTNRLETVLTSYTTVWCVPYTQGYPKNVQTVFSAQTLEKQ